MIKIIPITASVLLLFASTFAFALALNNSGNFRLQKPFIGLKNQKDIKNKFANLRFNTSELKVNGKNIAEIKLEDSVFITFTFFPGRSRAELSAYIDFNRNGILDDSDKPIITPVQIADGDLSDADRSINGKYKTSLSYVTVDNVHLNAITGTDIFIFENDGVYKGYVTIKAKAPETSFPVIGLVPTPRNVKNLAIIAVLQGNAGENRYMTFSDDSGRFCFDLPYNSTDSYEFSSKDIFNLLGDNYFQPKPATVKVFKGTGNLILGYTEKRNFISGKLSNENGKPVANASVYAEDIYAIDGQSIYTGKTDSAGFYRIGVKQGIYSVGINAGSIFPDYLFKDAIDSVVINNDENIKEVNFNLFSTNRTVSGKVTIDGKCAKDAYVAAWSILGSIWQKTNSKGMYSLRVNSSAHYNIEVNPESIPSGHVALNSNYRNISPDGKDINFIYEKVDTKIEGTVTEALTLHPLEGVYIAATDGMRTMGTQTGKDGHYSFSGLSGSYFISVSKNNQLYKQIDTIVNAYKEIYHLDFNLEKYETFKKDVDYPSADLIVQNNSTPDDKQSTSLKYKLSQNSHVILQILDVTGNKIATLENRTKPAGVYEVPMNSLNLSNGVYQCKLKAGSFSKTRKFIYIR